MHAPDDGRGCTITTLSSREVYRNQTPDRFRVLRGRKGEALVLDAEWKRPPTPCANPSEAAQLAALWNLRGPEQRAAERQITMEEALA